MKRFFWTCFFGSCIYALTFGQEPVLVTGFRQTDIIIQDSIALLVSLGDQFGYTQVEDDIVITNSIWPFTQSTDSVTALKPVNKIEGLEVYPNPTPGILIMERGKSQDELMVEIFDQKGVLVKSFPWPAYVNVYQPSLEDFSTGIYYMRVTNKDRSLSNEYKILRK